MHLFKGLKMENPFSSRILFLFLLCWSLLFSTNAAWSFTTKASGYHPRQRSSFVTCSLFHPTKRGTRSSTTTTTTTQLFASKDENKNNKKPITGVTLKLAFDRNWGVGEQQADDDEDVDPPPSVRFTCEESLDMVHRLRRDSDAVLVGRGTVARDDCSLTVRRGIETSTQPLRVILDPRLSLLLAELNDGARYQVFSDGYPTVVYHCVPDVDIASLNLLESVSVVYVPPPKDGVPEELPESRDANRPGLYVTPTAVVENLKTKYNVQHVMVEGGPVTAMNFLQSGIVDRAIIVRAPIEFQQPVQSGMSEGTLQAAGLELVGSRASGVDTIDYWVRPGESWPSGSIHDWP
jgi:riboflavin biosynthesis pyrimidine reductase